MDWHLYLRHLIPNLSPPCRLYLIDKNGKEEEIFKKEKKMKKQMNEWFSDVVEQTFLIIGKFPWRQ
jgi:hypothetical protein